MEETVALVKSCIISKKGGVPIEDLNGESQRFFYLTIINILFSKMMWERKNGRC